jgi:hypothetical protein
MRLDDSGIDGAGFVEAICLLAYQGDLWLGDRTNWRPAGSCLLTSATVRQKSWRTKDLGLYVLGPQTRADEGESCLHADI